MKQYFEVQPNNEGVTHIKVETFYDIGGTNYFTGKVQPRGGR